MVQRLIDGSDHSLLVGDTGDEVVNLVHNHHSILKRIRTLFGHQLLHGCPRQPVVVDERVSLCQNILNLCTDHVLLRLGQVSEVRVLIGYRGKEAVIAIKKPIRYTHGLSRRTSLRG